MAKLPRLTYAWHTPQRFTAGDAAMDVIADTLATETGRLYQRLVLQEQLAVAVVARQASRQLSSVLYIDVVMPAGTDVGKVDRIMVEEIDKLRNQPISEAELGRFLANNEARVIWGLESLLTRAELLQTFNHYTGNPDYLGADLNRYRKLTSRDIKQAAVQYLGKNRVELLTIPAKGGN